MTLRVFYILIYLKFQLSIDKGREIYARQNPLFPSLQEHMQPIFHLRGKYYIVVVLFSDWSHDIKDCGIQHYPTGSLTSL